MVVIEVAHVDQVDFTQAQASVSDQIQPCLQERKAKEKITNLVKLQTGIKAVTS